MVDFEQCALFVIRRLQPYPYSRLKSISHTLPALHDHTVPGLPLVELHRGHDSIGHNACGIRIMDLISHYQFWQMSSADHVHILNELVKSGFPFPLSKSSTFSRSKVDPLLKVTDIITCTLAIKTGLAPLET